MKTLTTIIDNIAYEVPLSTKKVTFTFMPHECRKRLKLDLYEFTVFDTVCQLSKRANKAGGWCYASKQWIADLLDISRPTVHRIINKGLKEGLLERHPETRNLRTTLKWFQHVQAHKEKGVKKFNT